MIKHSLNENFICRIWENGSYYKDLKTTEGKSVEIFDTGIRNSDAGPDYYGAKIRIEGVTYNGCVEIHKTEKEWHEHKHRTDNKYNSVILQVLLYKDEVDNDSMTPLTKKSRNIPTVVLSEFLTKSIRDIWKEIIYNPSESFRLPCYPQNKDIPFTLKSGWFSELSIQRLKNKSLKINHHLEIFSEDCSKKIFWEKVLFDFICEALGYSKNKKQFLTLAGNIDLSKLRGMKLNRIQADSIMFGLSGFLKDLRFNDKYIYELKLNWNELRDKIRRDILDKSEWNFFRLRPANFPTLRIAYASGILYEVMYGSFFRSIVSVFEKSGDISKSINDIFRNIEVNNYWKHHYNFGRESRSEISVIGTERIKDITVNVLLPVMYLYSEKFEKASLKKRIEFFCKSEKQKSGGNELIRKMEKQLDVNVKSVSDEQALIHLYDFYCLKGKCRYCEIGKIVFSKERINEPMNIIIY